MFEGINLEDDSEAAPPPERKGFKFRKPICPYVCSTPLDFSLERDFLAEKIYPNIVKFAQRRGAYFSPIDIRWSPEEKVFTDGELLQFLLDHINKCSPFFICLLGQCYGPHKKETSQNNIQKYDMFMDRNTSVASTTGYQWVLQETHQMCSITELEIIHAAFLGDGTHCNFYFRQSEHLSDKCDLVSSDEEKEKLCDLYHEENEHAGLKMKDLRHRIVKKGLTVKYFKTLEELGNLVLNDWTHIIDLLYPLVGPFLHIDNETYSEWLTQESFAESRREVYVGSPDNDAVMQQLSDFALTALDEVTPDVSEMMYKKYKTSSFGSNRSVVDPVPAKYKSILCLTGDRGAGKSSIIAMWLQDFQDMNPSVKLIYHFISSSSHSTDIAVFLRRCITELRSHFLKSDDLEEEKEEEEKEEEEVYLCSSIEDEPTNFKELCEAFVSAISICPCILVLDGLDELGGTLHYLAQTVKEFNWLPKQLPVHCKIIMSSTRSDLSYRSLSRRQDITFVATPVNLCLDRKKEILKTFMGHQYQHIQPNHFKMFKDIKLSAKPLFLMALSAEMKCSSVQEDLENFLEDNLEVCSVRQFWMKSLQRWIKEYSWIIETDSSEDVYNNGFEYSGWIVDALCLISLSRNGLTQNEILQLLKDIGYTDSLEVSVFDWLRFRLCVGSALYDKADGLICFSHQHIKEIVQFILLKSVKSTPGELMLAKYINSPRQEDKIRIHSHLAKYFAKQPYSERKIEELPWQLMMAGDIYHLLDVVEDLDYFIDLVDKNGCYPSNKQDLLVYWDFLAQHGITADQHYYEVFVKMGLFKSDLKLLKRAHTPPSSVVSSDKARSESVYTPPTIMNGEKNRTENVNNEDMAPVQDVVPPLKTDVSVIKERASENKSHIGGLMEDNEDNIFITESQNKSSLQITGEGRVIGPGGVSAIASLAWHVALFLLELGFSDTTQKILSSLAFVLQKNYPLCYNDQVVLAKSLEVVGNVFKSRGQNEQADSNYSEALKIVVDLMEMDYELTTNPELNILRSRLLDHRGRLCLDEGELYDAEEFLKEALEYVDDSLKTIPLASTILYNLGVLRLKQSDLIRAESVLRQSLSLREQWFGKSHPLVADVLQSLAQLLATSDYKNSDKIQAEHLYRRAIQIREDCLGPQHLLTADLLYALGCLIGDVSTISAKNESIKLLTQALDIRTSQLGGANIETKSTQQALTNQEVMLRLGHYEFGHAKPADIRCKCNPFSTMTFREKDLKRTQHHGEKQMHEVLSIRSFSREEMLRHNRPMSFISSSNSYISGSEKLPVESDRLLRRNSIERKLKPTIDQDQNGESPTPPVVTRPHLMVDMNFVSDSTMEGTVTSCKSDVQKEQLIESFASEDDMSVQDKPKPAKSIVRSRINSRPGSDPFKTFMRFASAGSTRSRASKMSASTLSRSKTSLSPGTPASSIVTASSAKSHVSRCGIPGPHSLHVSNCQSVIGPHSCITSLLDAKPLPRDMKRTIHHNSAWYHVPGRYTTPEQFYPSKRSQTRPSSVVSSFSQTLKSNRRCLSSQSYLNNPSNATFQLSGQSDKIFRQLRDSERSSRPHSSEPANEKQYVQQNGHACSSMVKFQETVSVG